MTNGWLTSADGAAKTHGHRRARPLGHTMLVALALWLVLAIAVSAEAVAGPRLTMHSVSNTTAKPGGTTTFFVEIFNSGDPADGSQIDLKIDLPDGLSFAPGSVLIGQAFGTFGDCSGLEAGTSDTCSISDETFALTGPLIAYIRVSVDPSASGTLTTEFQVSGGGSPPVSTVDPVTISATPPPFGLDAFDGLISNVAGQPYGRAGGTPYSASVSIDFNTHIDPRALATPPGVIPTPDELQSTTPIEPVKDVSVDLPAGLVGRPAGLPQCTMEQLAQGINQQEQPMCPVESQIGVTMSRVDALARNWGPIPVYNMVPPPGLPARFGFQILGTLVVMDARVGPGPEYSLSIDSRNIPEVLRLGGTTVTFWGVPADPSHDFQRPCPGEVFDPRLGAKCASSAEPTAFLRLPTACAGPLEFGTHIDSWTDPGAFDSNGRPDLSDDAWESASVTSHDLPGYPSHPSDWGAARDVTGCNGVPFNPSISVDPTSSQADSPTGLDVEVKVPQTDDPATLSSSDLKKAVVVLPEGMTVNPSSANGLGGCSPSQIGLGSVKSPSCPGSSKVGTVEVDTPLLDRTLPGAVYLAEQDDNPFDTLLALYVVIDDPQSGVVVKLPGRVDLDAQSGQLTATFDQTPQLPFSSFRLSFFDGPRAALRTPRTCGTYAIDAQLTGWARPSSPVERGDVFQITSGPGGSPCPGSLATRPFSPSFAAGTSSPLGGVFSPFALKVTRADGMSELSSLSVELPDGLLAKLAGVPLCPRSAITATAANCPAGSRVGTVDAGAGAGPSPFFLKDQPVYLTEGYGGAPYGLAVVTHVVAGPFDLGTVVVRQALHVDRDDAHVTVVSDRFPTILQGIPLHIRSVIAKIDRPGFTRTPTDCDPGQVSAAIRSVHGQSAARSTRFQVADCARLAFEPRLRMRLTGRRHTRFGGHPGVRAVLTQPAGQAGIEATEVRLPSSLALDVRRAQSDSLCEWRESLKDEPRCPVASVIGRAKAYSPLLNRPLEGPVYFAKRKRINSLGNEISTFPSLVLALRGEVDLNVRANTTVEAMSLVATLPQIPDAPVTRFELTLAGGKRGILVVTKTQRGKTISLCNSRQTAEADIDAHNGRRADQDVRIKTPCARPATNRRR